MNRTPVCFSKLANVTLKVLDLTLIERNVISHTITQLFDPLHVDMSQLLVQ
jgi:hypothetical protein